MNVLKGLKLTFSKRRYRIGAILIAVVFFLGNVLIKNRASISEIFQTQGINLGINYAFILVRGFPETVELYSFITLVITSILLGILISVFLFKVSIVSTGTGLLSTLGVALSLFVPGCAVCGVGVAALLGFSGATLSFLPLNGFEFSLLAVILLALSIALMAERIILCEIPRRSKK